jgi:hypothetical protein
MRLRQKEGPGARVRPMRKDRLKAEVQPMREEELRAQSWSRQKPGLRAQSKQTSESRAQPRRTAGLWMRLERKPRLRVQPK